MPDKEFKAGVYDVMVDGQPITLQSEDVFRAAILATAERSTNERWQEWTEKPRRMEAYRLHNQLHLMNFVTAEFAGPGRTGRSVPASPIGLRDDEYFAQETAALYDPSEGILLLESGVVGMGPGAIKTYFRQFNPTCILALPRRIDTEAVKKARSFQEIRQLHVQVSIPPMLLSERKSGGGVLQALGADYRARLIDVVWKCARAKDSTLDGGRVNAVIDAVVHGNGDEDYERVKVKGRAEEDEPLELIDLISQPLKSERRLAIDPATRQIFHEDKWNALINIHTEFMQL